MVVIHSTVGSQRQEGQTQQQNDPRIVLGDSRTDWFARTSSTESMRTWPRRIASRSEVPPVFLPGGVFDAEEFPYAVLIPENVVFANGRAVKTRRKIVALFPESVVVLENVRSSVSRHDHPLSGIQYLSVEDVLLSAVITIVSATGRSRIGYNTVRDDLFAPVITAIRRDFHGRSRGSRSPGPVGTAGGDAIEAVPGIDFKFVNYARKSLVPGDGPREIFFKSSARVRSYRAGLFRLGSQFTSPVLLMKTGNELIAIEEPVRKRASKKMEYGGIFTYLPLVGLRDVAAEGNLPVRLKIVLSGGVTLEFLLPDQAGLPEFLAHLKNKD